MKSLSHSNNNSFIILSDVPNFHKFISDSNSLKNQFIFHVFEECESRVGTCEGFSFKTELEQCRLHPYNGQVLEITNSCSKEVSADNPTEINTINNWSA